MYLGDLLGIWTCNRVMYLGDLLGIQTCNRVMYLGDLLGKYLLRDVTGAADDCVDPDQIHQAERGGDVDLLILDVDGSHHAQVTKYRNS